MTSAPPPSYNTATAYNAFGGPGQQYPPPSNADASPQEPMLVSEEVRVDQGPAYSPVPQGEWAPPGIPAEGGFYAPPASTGYGAPPAQNPAYPPAPGYPPQGGTFPPQGGMFPPQGGMFPPPPPRFPAGQGYSNPMTQGYNSGPSPPTQPMTNPTSVQPENGANWQSESWAGSSFSDKHIRMAFIRKVYMILMVQLSFTFGIVCLFVFHQGVKQWVRRHSWIYWPSYAVFLITYIILLCCPSVRRKWPLNFICLAIFTIAMSYIAGTVSSFYDTESVLAAMGITAGVCLAISIFACQTKIDFTKCGGVLFAGCIALFLFGMVCMVWYLVAGPNRILQCVYGGIAAVLFSLFLAYDTQMLIGGHKHQLSPEEHIFGALQLYLDVVYLFLIILSLFGGKSN